MRTIDELDPTNPEHFTVEMATKVFLEEYANEMSDDKKLFTMGELTKILSVAMAISYKFGKTHECTIRQAKNG